MGVPLPLVDRFPALAALPRLPFVEVPTPVEPLRLAGVPEGALWVKRDDVTCPIYGGNKPRKLEFVLGAAAASRSRRLVTTGGLGTHHGLATALLARSQGMATTIVLVPQPVTGHVRQQLEAMWAAGAELVPARGVASAVPQVLRVLARSALRGERPRLVPTGGTSALGDIGFVSAACELADQMEAGALPEPREVYVPVGSGGTLSGLVLGARLAGLRTRFVGVVVTDILPPSPARLARLAAATLRRLRHHAPSLPALRIAPEDFTLTSRQLGAGYGAPTEAAAAAASAARAAGLRLEPVYTSKCLAEALQRLREGSAETPLLFWHTYSSVGLARASAAALRPGPLPAALQRLLDRAPREDAP
jgi:D-cysteine desulfhydrase